MYNQTVREHFWMWAHETGSHNDNYNLAGASRMTPVEGAFYLGVPNLIFVVYRDLPAPPFHQYAIPMRPLRHVVWSIVGDSSSKRNDETSDLDDVLELARDFPNVTGAILDDFFHDPDEQGRIARWSPDDLAGFQSRMRAGEHPLDLWVVLYTHELALPTRDHLDHCDVVALWTWKASELANLPANFEALESLAPDKRKMLGCYLWDYGVGAPMPVESMQRQCEFGLDMLKAGRIDGMIFLASCICDLEIESVEWTRAWIADVGDEGMSLPD